MSSIRRLAWITLAVSALVLPPRAGEAQSPPAISAVSPQSQTVLGEVTITGSGFGATQGTSRVTFSGGTKRVELRPGACDPFFGDPAFCQIIESRLDAPVLQWSDTQLRVTVPDNAKSGDVQAIVNGLGSNRVGITVLPTILLSPASARVFQEIAIIGKNFGASSTGAVTFHGGFKRVELRPGACDPFFGDPAFCQVTELRVPAEILSWTDTSISVRVPDKSRDGAVVVISAGLSSNRVTIQILPTIFGVSPNPAGMGTNVDIWGWEFGAAAFVRIGAVDIAPNTQTGSSLTITIPDNAVSGDLVVHSNGRTSNAVPFTVIPRPQISSLTPASGPPGTLVVVQGANFGDTQGGGRVVFSPSLDARVLSWSHTRIEVLAPDAVQDGPVVVEKDGMTSNAVHFDVTAADRADEDITPSLTCVHPRDGSSHYAVFGYTNAGDDSIALMPETGRNTMEGVASAYMGQPLVLHPGLNEVVVAVPFPSSGEVTWRLGGGSATARAGSLSCSDPSVRRVCVTARGESGLRRHPMGVQLDDECIPFNQFRYNGTLEDARTTLVKSRPALRGGSTFVTGVDGHLMERVNDGGTFRWVDHGLPPGAMVASSPAVSTWTGGIDVFVRGSNGKLYARTNRSGSWSWDTLGFPLNGTRTVPMVGAPAPLTWRPLSTGAELTSVFVKTADGRLSQFDYRSSAHPVRRWTDRGTPTDGRRRAGLDTDGSPTVLAWGPPEAGGRQTAYVYVMSRFGHLVEWRFDGTTAVWDDFWTRWEQASTRAATAIGRSNQSLSHSITFGNMQFQAKVAGGTPTAVIDTVDGKQVLRVWAVHDGNLLEAFLVPNAAQRVWGWLTRPPQHPSMEGNTAVFEVEAKVAGLKLEYHDGAPALDSTPVKVGSSPLAVANPGGGVSLFMRATDGGLIEHRISGSSPRAWEYHKLPASLPNCRRERPADGFSTPLADSEIKNRFRYYLLASTPAVEWQGSQLLLFGTRVNGRLIEGSRAGASGEFDWKDRHCAGPNVTWDDFAKVSGCKGDLKVNVIFPQWVTTVRHDDYGDLAGGRPEQDTPSVFAGTVLTSSVTPEDNFVNHARSMTTPLMNHDWNIFVAPDLAHQHMLGNGNFPREDGKEGSLEVEWEQASDKLSTDAIPGVGESVWMKGRWIQDCGHHNKTEIHAPNALVVIQPAISSTEQPATRAVLRLGRKGGPLFYKGSSTDCGPGEKLLAKAKAVVDGITWWKPWTWGPAINAYLYWDGCERHDTPVGRVLDALHPDGMCFAEYAKHPADDLGTAHHARSMQRHGVRVEFDVPLPPAPGPDAVPRMLAGPFERARFLPADGANPARFRVLVGEANINLLMTGVDARTTQFHAFWDGSTTPSTRKLAVCAQLIPRRHHEPGDYFWKWWCDDDTTDETVAYLGANGSWMRLTPRTNQCTTVTVSTDPAATLAIRAHGFEADMSNNERWDDDIMKPAPDDMIGIASASFSAPDFGVSSETYVLRSYASTRTNRSRDLSHEDYELRFTVRDQPADPEPFPIFFQHEVSLEVAAAGESVSAGGEVRYTVTLTNQGSLAAEGVVVDGTLSKNAMLESCEMPGGTCEVMGDHVTLSPGTLASGATVTATVVARANCDAVHGLPVAQRLEITEGAAHAVATADVIVVNTLDVSPREASYGPAGGTGSISVAGMTGTCTWSVDSQSAWLQVTSAAEMTGTGTVTYSVAPNDTDRDRNGILTVAGRTVTITQTARAPQIAAVSPSSAAAGTEVTITGTSFRTGGEARIGDVLLEVISWTDTQVRARIPQGTAEGATNLRVFAQGQGSLLASNPVAFTVTRACTPVFPVDGARDNYLEAEIHTRTAGTRFQRVTDGSRSSAAYMQIPQGAGSFTTAGTSPDHLVFDLNVVSGGTFNVWLLGAGPDTSSDSFWVTVDSGADVSVNNIPLAWTWVKSPATVSMPTGTHTLRIKNREDGARIDKILLTKLTTTPSGLGGGALGACSRPSAPTGLAATAGSGRVTLNWTASAGAASHNVKRGATGNGPFMLLANLPVSAGATFVDTSVENGALYHYVVSAVGAGGESPDSASVSARPDGAPLEPVMLAATVVSPGRVDLAWGDVASNETGYAVERATIVGTTTGAFTRIATLPANTRSHSDVSVAAGATYVYRVQATAGTPSGYSNEATVTLTVAALTSLSPTSGAVGATVTLTGSNFGPTQGAAAVRFGSVVATPTSWSASSIVTTVPTGATTGPVTVTVGSVASNAVTFTVNVVCTTTYNVNGSLDQYLEAERHSRTAGTRFQQVTDAARSAGAYMQIPQGAGSFTTAGTSPDHLVFDLNVTNGGDFNVWILGSGVDTSSDSFWVSVDGGTDVSVNGIPAAWTWMRAPVLFPMTTGTHTLRIKNREDGAKIDKILLTRSGTASPVVPGPTALQFCGGLPPSISTLSPTSGGVGTAVTITGTGFGAAQGGSQVSFSGTLATPTSWSDTLVVAPVPAGALSGNVRLRVGGVDSNGVFFTVTTPAPQITSLSPTSGAPGSSVTIAGSNFGATQGTSVVSFGGPAATVTSWSNSTVVATVPGATIGPVAVTVNVNGVASNGVVFTVIAPTPQITSLSPTTGGPGTSVTISGSNFGASQGTSAVRFNGVAASVASWSGSSVVATVPASATTGPVTVTVNGVSSNGVTFTVSTACTPGIAVDGLADNYLEVEDYTNATDTGFVRVADATRSGGAYMRVPDGTGNFTTAGTSPHHLRFTLHVTNGGTFNVWLLGSGPDTSSDSFWVNVDDGTDISINNIPAAWTWVKSATTVSLATGTHILKIKAREDAAQIDKILLTRLTTTPSALGGAARTVCRPQITSVNPSSGPSGTLVVLSGARFGTTQGTSTVTFGGVPITGGNWTDTRIDAPVPAGALTGNVVVTVSQVRSNGVPFTVPAGPSLTSLSPTSGPVGSAVSIFGQNLGSTQGGSTVRFNGVLAAPTFWSMSQVNTSVPSGATSGNVVVTVGGSPSNGLLFTVATPPPPRVTSLTPSYGPVGTVVTIVGTDFGATQTANSLVRFNGLIASPTSWSNTQITVPVPAGAESGPVLVWVGTQGNMDKSFTVTTTPTCPAYTVDGLVHSYIEAEGFNMRSGHFGRFQRFLDLSASRSELMYNGIGEYLQPGTSEDLLVYNLNVVNGGTFTLWLLTSAFPDAAPHSFWVGVDDQPDQPFDLFGTSVAWTRHLSTFNLPSGSHRLRISSRHPNTKVDKLVLTKNASFVPFVPGPASLSTCAPPPAPTGLTATPRGTGEVCLNWTGSATAMSHSVAWGTSSRQYTSEWIDEPVTSRCVSFLTSGVRYFFGAKAYNAGGFSGFSAEVSAVAP